jgi:hypothetical protein
VTGDFVVIDQEYPLENYQVGDPILYQSAQVRNIIIIHRIFDIKEINESLFFAIKGDANPQPDVVAGNSPVLNFNQTTLITWDYFYPDSENPQTQIPISYFPAENVVLGKVINKLPFLGWLFVPFKSPVGDPFGFLPISLFGMFFTYFIIVAIGSLFYLIKNANETLRDFLRLLKVIKKVPKQRFRIGIPYIYQLLIIPLLIFELAFLATIPGPIVVKTEFTLEKAELVDGLVPHWNLEYDGFSGFNSSQISQKNTTTIKITLWNQSNLLYANYSRDFHAISTSIIPEYQFQVSEHDQFFEIIDPYNMYILSSNNTEDPNLGKIFEFQIPKQEKEPIGLMTRNIFLAAQFSEYKGIAAYETSIDYSFIQELIKVRWKVNAFFSQESGFLLYLKVEQTEALWAIPEMLFMLIPVIIILIYYEFIRSRIQKSFDERQANILIAQEQDTELVEESNELLSSLESVWKHETSRILKEQEKQHQIKKDDETKKFD